MPRLFLLTASFLLLTLVASPGAAQITISGRVVTESGEGLEGAVVRVDESITATDGDGGFNIQLQPADIYQLHYSADHHFPMIHSYSALELSWLQSEDSSQSVEVPDVSLVEQAPGRIMLVFGGDMMMGRRFSQPAAGEPALIRDGHRAEDTVAVLRYIRPYLEIADYASVNLETQVMAARPAQNAPKSYVFFTPPEALQALKVSGVDYVTLGNNHTYDYLAEGLESTLTALQESGLGWSGAGMTESRALKPHQVEIGGNPMSFLGFLGWTGNFTPNQVAQGDEKGGAALGSGAAIGTAVRSEAEQGFLPVVQYHGSREYTDEPTLVTESRLKQAIDDGAVLAIGHHPHIVQGFEIYKGKLIAYSLGNFVFDQYHYATKRSYLLYVWLDRDLLHRAEVMPLRIKGYLPMPATDTFRQTILRRVNELSTRRGVVLETSGGNAIILADLESDPSQTASPLSVPPRNAVAGATVLPLVNRGWNEPVDYLILNQESLAPVRLGKNLLPMGHLESHDLHGAPDRSWISDGSQSVVKVENAPSGERVMQLTVPAGSGDGMIGMRTFEYLFRPGTPTTFRLMARADAPAVVTAYQQWRKRDENRLEALDSARLRIIGQQNVTAGEWQELRFDFNSPRVTAISYRVVLNVTPRDSSRAHSSWFDDIALIEWLSPPLTEGKIPAHIQVKQASHLDLGVTPP